MTNERKKGGWRRNPWLLGLMVVLVACVIAIWIIRQRQARLRLAAADALLMEAQELKDQLAAVDALLMEAQELKDQHGRQSAQRELLELALAICKELHAGRQDPAITARLALTHFRMAKVVKLLQSPEEAISWYERARDLQQELVDEFPAESAFSDELADTLNAMGIALQEVGDMDAAWEAFTEAKTIRALLTGLPSQNNEYQRKLANSHMNLGTLEMWRERWDDAEREFIEAQEIRTKLDKNSLVRRDTAKGLYNLGYLQLLRGDDAGAVATLQSANDVFEKLAAESQNLESQYSVALCHGLLADAQFEIDPAAAMVSWQTARKLAQQLLRDNPDVLEYQRLAEGLDSLFGEPL